MTRWTNAVAALWIGCTLFFSPSQSQAKDKGKVRLAILPYKSQNSGLSDNDKAWLSRLTSWAMRRRPRLDLVSKDDIRQKLSAAESSMSPEDAARVRAAKRYISKGKLLYTRFKRYKIALKSFQIAEKLVLKVTQWPNDPKPIADMYFFRALCYMALRQGLPGRTYMIKTAQFDLNYEPPSTVPSSYLSYYRTIQSWVKRKAKYRLVFQSVPSGARVYFNMRYKGLTPLTIRQVPPGRHSIQLSRTGYKVWSKTANLDEKQITSRFGKRVEFSNQINMRRDPKALTMEGVPIFARDAKIDDNILDRLQKISIKLNAKHIYVVDIHKRGSEVLLKMATFQRDQRTIRYKTVALGRTRRQHRIQIQRFARLLETQLAPAPRLKKDMARKIPKPVPRRPKKERAVMANNGGHKYPIARASVPRREPARVAVLRPRPMRPLIRRPVAPPRVTRKPLQRPAKEPSKTGTPFYGTWWFWTTVGTVAVAATATVIVVTQFGPPPSATFIVTTE